MLTLKQLKYFVRVAEQGSIKAAATELFISQSAIAASITQLENTFGVQLLIRQKSKGVALTPAGRLMLEKSHYLLKNAHEISILGREFSQSMQGTLSIGIFHTLAPYILPQLLATYQQMYPHTHLSLFEGDQQEIQMALKEGLIEIAITYDIGVDEEMTFHTLKALPPYLVVAANSPFAQQKNLKLKDLREEPLVLLDLPYSREYFYAIFQKIGFMPKIGYKTKSVPMLRSLIAEGLGYSILNYMTPDYKGNPLIYINIDDIDHSLNLIVSWRTNTQLSMKAKAFLKMVKESFQNA